MNITETDIDTWYTNFGDKSTKPLRLLCFPSSGSGSNMYRGWAGKMPDIEVVALKLPAREKRFGEPSIDCLESLLDQLVPVTAQLMNKPCAFFGHSMGALIAFELARSLMSKFNKSPEQLIASAFRSPERKSLNKELHTLSDNDFLTELKKYGGTPSELLNHEETMKLLLPMLRADFKLHETYVYQNKPKIPSSIAAFWGKTDQFVPFDHMENWISHCAGDFSMEGFTGGHFYLIKQSDQVLRSIDALMQPLITLKNHDACEAYSEGCI